jgi:hypothetical protein
MPRWPKSLPDDGGTGQRAAQWRMEMFCGGQVDGRSGSLVIVLRNGCLFTASLIEKYTVRIGFSARTDPPLVLLTPVFKCPLLPPLLSAIECDGFTAIFQGVPVPSFQFACFDTSS